MQKSHGAIIAANGAPTNPSRSDYVFRAMQRTAFNCASYFEPVALLVTPINLILKGVKPKEQHGSEIMSHSYLKNFRSYSFLLVYVGLY